MKTTQKKPTKVPIKPFLVLLKEKKASRKEKMNRVFGFRETLTKTSKQIEIFQQQIADLAYKMQLVMCDNGRASHLIEMYRIMDEHDIMDIWRLEKACGLTNKSYPNWKKEFDSNKNNPNWYREFESSKSYKEFASEASKKTTEKKNGIVC